MRMILPGELELPIKLHCRDVDITTPDKSVEISRLVISKRLRRRHDDGMYYGPQSEDKKGVSSDGTEFLRRAKPMAFGLYRELYRESKRLGITQWYALMEKSLWLLLRIHGFEFEPIGKEVDVYGPVKPYIGEISKIEKEVYQKFPKFFAYFTEELNREHLPNFCVI